MSLYSPLATDVEEIRLLHIQPGSLLSPVQCTLETVPHGDFSQHPEGIYDWASGEAHVGDWKPEDAGVSPIRWVPVYEALSYTWGDPNDREEIQVNNQVMRVTKNLKAALLALRDADEERVMWVDAVCINQDDIQERNIQVTRMRSIYQRAARTIAWLGDTDPTALHAMDVVESLGGTKAHMDQFEMPDPLFWGGPMFDWGYGPDGDAQVFQDKVDHAKRQVLVPIIDLEEHSWAALETFFQQRPYWQRLWIVQEIANSRAVIFQRGSRQMGIETFQFLAKVVVHGDVSTNTPSLAGILFCHSTLGHASFEVVQGGSR